MAFFARVSQLKQDGQDIISLAAGELDCPSPPCVCDAGIKAIKDGFTRYTVNSGIIELRQAISNKLAEDNSLTYSSDQILISNGAKQVLFNLLFTLCGKDDEVIIFSPYYPTYPELIKIAQAKPVIVPTFPEDNFQIDRERLAQAVTRKTKLIILNTPNNPTGAVYSRESLSIISNIIKEYDIWLLSDEIYEKIVYPPDVHYSPPQLFPELINRTLIVNGFSKTYAMTGWRIGYGAGPKEIIDKAALIQSHTTSNASSISQKAAVMALESGNNFIEEIISTLEIKRNRATSILNSIEGVQCPQPSGAFYLFPSIKKFLGSKNGRTIIKSSYEMAEYLLNKKNVAVVPGTTFGDDESIRISFATDIDSIEKGCLRIKEGLELL